MSVQALSIALDRFVQKIAVDRRLGSGRSFSSDGFESGVQGDLQGLAVFTGSSRDDLLVPFAEDVAHVGGSAFHDHVGRRVVWSVLRRRGQHPVFLGEVEGGAERRGL